MRYQIIHGEAFPVAKIDLQQGEYINAESDAMIAMSGTVDVNGTMNGGLLGGIARRLLTSESFFTQKLTASRGPGWVVIGHSLPGGITDPSGYGCPKPRSRITIKRRILCSESSWNRNGIYQ